MTKTHEKGGLNFGTVGSSIVLLSILGICILFTTLKGRRLVAVTESVSSYTMPQDKNKFD